MIDSYFMILDPSNWESYKPFFVKSLGLTNENDVNRILCMDFTEELGVIEFVSEQYDIKVTYLKLNGKFHLTFDRRRYHYGKGYL